jgi:hypothetical protein
MNYTFVVGIVDYVDRNGNMFTKESLEDLEKQINQKGYKTWWSMEGTQLWASIPMDQVRDSIKKCIDENIN